MRILQIFILCCVACVPFCGSASYAETVKIIAEDDWYPYSGQTSDGIQGMAVDIVRAVFKAEGITVEFDVMNYDRGMLLVKDGKAIGCFNAPRTREIEETYLWHEQPMYKADNFFYATDDYVGTIHSVKDMEGKTLGLTQGYGYGNVIDTNNSIIKEYSKTDEIIIKKLLAKRLDFIILFDRVAEHLMSKMDIVGKIKPVGLSDSSYLYVAFSKKHPDGKKYCDIFSHGFAKIKQAGIYQQIIDSWDAKLKDSGKKNR